MGHISDRTLDNLLDGSIDDATEIAIEEHVRHCDRCAHRLREWEQLFPQVRSIMPTGEHPVPPAEPAPHVHAHAPAFATARGPAVFVPDWSPPPTHHRVPVRFAWGLVVVLALGAGYLVYQRTQKELPSIGYLPETVQPSTQSASVDSAGLGSGMPMTTEIPPATLEEARIQQESTLARLRAAAALEAQARQDSARPGTSNPGPTPPAETAEQDVRRPSPNREAPVSFPIRADASTTPARSDTPREAPAEQLPPLPAQFQRVTLGEAINRLAGTVRLIQGLNPEAVEIAQGSALPGADPAKPVVRVVYNAPEGRLIMDQQRVGRSGGAEPNISISTAPNGVSVAQWIDRGGFWISLAGRADQQTLLSIANRIR